MLPTRPSLVHVSKFPPTNSGIGLYAQAFGGALSLVAEVSRHRCPSGTRDTQSFRAALLGGLRGARQGRATPKAHVHVELGGRGLYEFYYALGALYAGSTVSVTAHDLPSIAGPTLLFTALDRRGLRKIGIALSRTVGKYLENQLLRRAQIVTLTKAGREWLRTERDTNAVWIGHVVDNPPLQGKDKQVFCPGYIGDPYPVLDLIRLVHRFAPSWRVVVGSCTDAAARTIEATAALESLPVCFTGHLEEGALLDVFANSRIVVRTKTSNLGSNSLAASGPLAWAVARGCVVITNDSRPGALELDALGLIEVVDDWKLALKHSLMSPSSSKASSDIARAAQEELGFPAVAGRFSSLLNSHALSI